MKSIRRINRRFVLKGLGGVALALPLLEGLAPRRAFAQSAAPADSFAVFFRQANGVAQASNGEPERFFPRELGALTEASLEGRSTGELVAYRDKLLILRNVNYGSFDWGDGHAAGALHGLTARGPVVNGAGGGSEASGESIDHRIGRELNPDGRDSMFFYAGQGGGWLNGACISYRASGTRRSALHDPRTGYQTLIGQGGGLAPEVADRLRRRGQSVNDLVREQLQSVRAMPQLSKNDRDRLDLHLSSVRDLEVNLGCRMDSDQQAIFDGAAPGFNSSDGDETLETARLHMDVAVLAIACGFTRSAAIQVGVGNDGHTRYRNLDDNTVMENYHYISHRQLTHGSGGPAIANADLLHSFVDRQFARTFRHLLDRLSEYAMPGGGTLLDRGVAVWYNDNANGPPHSTRNVPWVLAGGVSGALKQGQYLEITPGNGDANHARLLNTLGSVVGLRKANGDFIDDFGAPNLNKATLGDILA